MLLSVRHPWWAAAVLSTAACGAVIAACHSGSPEEPLLFPGDDSALDTGGYPTPDTAFEKFDLGGVDGVVLSAFAIAPLDAVVDVDLAAPVPALSYVATSDGATVAPAWSVDRGEIGTIDGSGVFKPSGKVGGKATITASFGGRTASTSVTVKLHLVRNGDPDAGKPLGGAGGNGGVGGEGPGAAVTDTIKGVLDSAPVADPALKWLYPYDKTVWPRGILAPLLQWDAAGHSFDAVRLQITETSFEFKGTFARTATPFVHHPIPQDVWKMVAYSNAGEDVTVSLSFSQGGKAYGPIVEKWKIAKGALKGTVYYNSYGTDLAHNYCCTAKGAKFGGATLAIKGGSTAPVLVAGNDTNCRVCHSVAANGSRLVTQRGENYSGSSTYNLGTLAETTMSPTDGRFAWPALSPDGATLFSNSSSLAGSSTATSALYSMPSGAPITTTGIPAGLRAALPTFAPDGKRVAFNFFGGTGGDGKSLATLDFDPTTNAFSALTTLWKPPSGTVLWPAFLPASDGLLFQLETVFNGRDFGGTRSTCDASGSCSDSGARGELWWIDLKTKTPIRLDAANGLGYLPTGSAAHDADATLNYEPTVNPIASGGYAWVVFTSRRLYGNVATINPYWSDPRFHDISTAPTPKKLWVAAIDLSAPAGTDPSHPAFYLPAQELLAGNSRGYWVVDPCKTDTAKCETGDECCGGFCQPVADGSFTCGSKPPVCATEFEKCTVDADCCGSKEGLKCVGGRCTRPGPA